MTIVEMLIAMVAALIFDWLAATRVAAYYPEFDYRYWPLSRERLISLIAFVLLPAFIKIVSHPDNTNQSLWPLIPACLVICVWAIVMCRDVFNQRELGYREPPIYGQRDYRDES